MEDVAEMHQQEAHGLPPPHHHRWDVVGLGQAMVCSVLSPFLVWPHAPCRYLFLPLVSCYELAKGFAAPVI
jgi:hypothetical protein